MWVPTLSFLFSYPNELNGIKYHRIRCVALSHYTSDPWAASDLTPKVRKTVLPAPSKQFPLIIRRTLPRDDWGEDLPLYFQQKPYYCRQRRMRPASFRQLPRKSGIMFQWWETNLKSIHTDAESGGRKMAFYMWRATGRRCDRPYIMNYCSTNHRIITVLSDMTLLPVGMKVALYSRTTIRIFIWNHRWDNHGLFRDDLKQPPIEFYFDHVVQKWERDENCQRKHCVSHIRLISDGLFPLGNKSCFWVTKKG